MSQQAGGKGEGGSCELISWLIFVLCNIALIFSDEKKNKFNYCTCIQYVSIFYLYILFVLLRQFFRLADANGFGMTKISIQLVHAICFISFIPDIANLHL